MSNVYSQYQWLRAAGVVSQSLENYGESRIFAMYLKEYSKRDEHCKQIIAIKKALGCAATQIDKYSTLFEGMKEGSSFFKYSNKQLLHYRNYLKDVAKALLNEDIPDKKWGKKKVHTEEILKALQTPRQIKVVTNTINSIDEDEWFFEQAQARVPSFNPLSRLVFLTSGKELDLSATGAHIPVASEAEIPRKYRNDEAEPTWFGESDYRNRPQDVAEFFMEKDAMLELFARIRKTIDAILNKNLELKVIQKSLQNIEEFLGKTKDETNKKGRKKSVTYNIRELDGLINHYNYIIARLPERLRRNQLKDYQALPNIVLGEKKISDANERVKRMREWLQAIKVTLINEMGTMHSSLQKAINFVNIYQLKYSDSNYRNLTSTDFEELIICYNRLIESQLNDSYDDSFMGFEILPESAFRAGYPYELEKKVTGGGGYGSSSSHRGL